MKKIIYYVLLLFMLVSCSKVILSGRKQLLLVPESEVLSASFKSYKQFTDSVPPSSDRANAALVKKVGKRISSAVEAYLNANGMSSDVSNFAWEFNLVKEKSVNAFCMPGGKVVVFEGILPITQNEVGLAVVLGHEIAHAVAKHSNERMSQQMVLQYGSAITDALVSNKSAVTHYAINALYGVGAQYGVILPYSRQHEYEADHLGLIFLAMAGYDPNEAITFWQRMDANSKSSSMEFMNTHPSDSHRIAKLKELMPEALKYYKK